ncbi:pfs domain-containing protein [Colletotrichum tabaci]|uniref:Pfs domain-containing protein n=1 Tax=Colletotrichum tabaci TaxID=1209068 RepID=A0AAV9TCL5_9PEZI
MSDPSLYTIGWICAIASEFVAAQLLLDEVHEEPISISRHDSNSYKLGCIGKNNVVIAVLPHGEYGLSSAAIVARDMLHTFENVRVGLMVGIGGGAPSTKNDIRLGDIVVSSPGGDHGGVFQYDFGKTLQGGKFHTTGFLNKPPTALMTALNNLISDLEIKGNWLKDEIHHALTSNTLKQKYGQPDPDSDRLFRSEVACDENNPTIDHGPGDFVERQKRKEGEDPVIHYGLIASANQVMKDARKRDALAAEKNVLCFEMEAAGLMNHFPCLIIRGICDYSDSHKNKQWQGYAAMAAAALVLDPLKRARSQQLERPRMLLVLDALDECSVEKDIQTVVPLLATLVKCEGYDIKVFVTSRPELAIHYAFDRTKGLHEEIRLHKVSQDTVSHDIGVFLRDELADIREKWNASYSKQPSQQMSADWPGQKSLDDLVRMTSPLFIFAATACRFIQDRCYGDPDQQLSTLLRDAKESGVNDKLGSTYLPALRQSLAQSSLSRSLCQSNH